MTINAKEINVNIFHLLFLQCWAKRLSVVYIHAVRSLFDSPVTVKEDSLIWSTASLDTLVSYTNFSKVDSARRRVSGLGSSSQWEGGTPKSSSHTRNLLTLVSPNQLSSCCCSFISTGEWPLYTRSLSPPSAVS